ncbi:uncharacterized protein V6R79_020796 [Siganus canaliculatus]
MVEQSCRTYAQQKDKQHNENKLVVQHVMLFNSNQNCDKSATVLERKRRPSGDSGVWSGFVHMEDAEGASLLI